MRRGDGDSSQEPVLEGGGARGQEATVAADEGRLARLLTDLAEEVPIPPREVNGAPHRREDATPTGARRSRRPAVFVAVAVAVAVAGAVPLVVVDRHGSHPAADRTAAAGLSGGLNGGGEAAAGAGSSGGAAGGGGAGAAAGEPGAASSSAGTAAQPAPAVPMVGTRIVKTGTVTIEVPKGRLSASIDQLSSTAAGLGGYVASTSTSQGGVAPTGDLTVRVPVAQFESLLSRARSLGVLTAITTNGQDVTSQYVDLQSRVTALADARQRYLTILARAATIPDILAVQQQIDNLQSQLEQLQGQLNVLDDQTTYSTLTAHLAEPAPPSPKPPAVKPAPAGMSKAWLRARSSFTHGVEAIVAASGGIALFLLCAAALALIGRLAWAVTRTRLT